MVIKILPNDKNVPTGKLADAEVHFTEGALDGLRLLGFAVWERRNFSLLRPIGSDNAAQNAIRDLVLQAYAEFESRAAVAS